MPEIRSSLASKHDHTATDGLGVNEPDWRRQPDRHWGGRRHDWPATFTVGFVVQGLFRHDEYDPIAETVSALEAGPNGWIQQLNFFVFGILMMIFGAGLGFGAANEASADCVRSRAVVGGWPADGRAISAPRERRRSDVRSDWIAPAERRGLLPEYVGRSGHLVLVSPPRRPLASLTRYTLITSVALALLFCCAGRFRHTVPAPLQPWAGLLQRVVLAVWFSVPRRAATRLWLSASKFRPDDAPIAICRLNTQRDPSSGQPYTAARCRFARMSCTVSSEVWLLESSQ